MPTFLEGAKQYIPAEIRMISGCRDDQTSADVQNVASFHLPDPAGRAGGACTSAFLEIAYTEKKKPEKNFTFQELLLQMRDVLQRQGFSQIPQLTSSRPLSIKTPFHIVPDGFSGKKYAVVIGINYVGSQNQLSGCQNDAQNMIEYIENVWGFSSEDIEILMDDGKSTAPTKENILKAYRNVVSKAKRGDVVFCHYSGHGGKLVDDNNDEKSGYDETIVPVDYNTTGQIRDDDLFKALVGPMAAGVLATVVMDSCFSGTVLDLPYTFVADGAQDDMTETPQFKFDRLEQLFNLLQESIPPKSGCCNIL